MKILKGKVKLNVNLLEYNLESGDMLFSKVGDLVEVREVSDDAEVCGIVFKNTSVNKLNFSQLDSSPFHPEGKAKEQNKIFFDLLWQVALAKPFHSATFVNMFRTFVADTYYIALENITEKRNERKTNSNEIFDKFLKLVNLYAKNERNIQFYADKLFLSPHYFSSIIKKESGQTVMYWINKQVILEAKVLLKHSNKLVFEISDELNFPNASFFNKFFKNQTGMTPKKFKNNI